MSDALARIVADKREHVAARRGVVSEVEIERRALAAPPCRGFAAALRQRTDADPPRTALIAEIKRASPSGGAIRPDLDVASIARAYARGGAACLSVLTDGPYFQGADSDLRAAREATALPILRKDFIVESYQIAESRALGADCILLILAALDDARAAELAQAARGYGMDVLTEIHDRAELDRAVRLGATMIGINNRDLKTLRTDLATSIELSAALPAGILGVAESGLRSREDVIRVAAVGIRCVLVGESLLRQPDTEAAARALIA